MKLLSGHSYVEYMNNVFLISVFLDAHLLNETTSLEWLFVRAVRGSMNSTEKAPQIAVVQNLVINSALYLILFMPENLKTEYKRGWHHLHFSGLPSI